MLASVRGSRAVASWTVNACLCLLILARYLVTVNDSTHLQILLEFSYLQFVRRFEQLVYEKR